MRLHYKEAGEGRPLILLHGLFGSGDNWATPAKSFAEAGWHTIMVDQRNHGRSPHAPEMSYPLMADDLQELIGQHQWDRPVLLGHSMGGKTVLSHAQRYPGSASGIVVVDIAPRFYAPHHGSVFSALNAVDLSSVNSRKEVEVLLQSRLADAPAVQLLLKNLYWNDRERLAWRFNIQALEQNIEEIGKELPEGPVIDVPTLFVRGGASGYITEEDERVISRRFSNAQVRTVQGAGHWIHADAPGPFTAIVNEFLTGLK